MSEPKLDWGSAAVKASTLTVEIEGEPPKAWKQGFATTVKLLGGGDWGEVSIRKGTVRVKDVAPGQEPKLRHFLDSVVDQANASHPTKADEEADTAPEDPDGDGEDDADTEMTRRFREFARTDAETDADGGAES